jgi:hypothetical protein
LVIIMRDEAGEQTSTPAVPGQSALLAHHKPLSEHILAGWPSAQKSSGRPGSVLHEVSVEEAQVVFEVTIPCLQEPHWVPADETQVSFKSRPEPSFWEISRQKSPLTTPHAESNKQ